MAGPAQLQRFTCHHVCQKQDETVEKRSDGENPAFYVPAGKIDRLPGVYLRNPQNGQLDSRSLFLVL
jgi:hypothetical protein